jgi:hypothetical protein
VNFLKEITESDLQNTGIPEHDREKVWNLVWYYRLTVITGGKYANDDMMMMGDDDGGG